MKTDLWLKVTERFIL